MLQRSLFIIFCLLEVIVPAIAADYNFRHLRNGLPHQQVEALAEDADGNIWIGTRNGLARYDGYDLTLYYHSDSNTKSLYHNYVRRLYFDRQGRLWIRTQNGVARYLPESDSFSTYYSAGRVTEIVETSTGKILVGGQHFCVYDEKADSFAILPSPNMGYIKGMAVDAKDNVYVATDRSIYYYDRTLTKITNLEASYYNDFLTGSDGIVPMFVDRQQNLWISRNGDGVEYIRHDNGELVVYKGDAIANGMVLCISQDAFDRIWLGTEGGITIVSPDGGMEHMRNSFNDTSHLSDNSIHAILHDSHGNVWIGSYFGGIDIITATSDQFQWYRAGYSNKNIKGKVPRGMVEVTNTQIWIATEDGGLNIFNPKDGTFSLFTDIPELGTNVHSLYHDTEKHDMWIGSYRNGLFCYDLNRHTYRSYKFSHGLESNSVFCFAKRKNGELWVGSTNGLRRYNPELDEFEMAGNELLGHTFIYTMEVDSDDNIWLGTDVQGLFCIDGKTNEVKQWSAEDPNNGLYDRFITDIYMDSSGTLFIGTNNNGLQYLDRATGIVHAFDEGSLLSRVCICSISEDLEHNLWVATSNGLFLLNTNDNSLKHFTTTSGLPTDQFNFASSRLISDGQMLLGSVNGLVSVRPKTLTQLVGPFEVQLKRLIVEGVECKPMTDGSPLDKPLNKMESIRLSYNEARSFIIDYGVIMPCYSGNISYQIMLEGIDKEWRSVGSERRFMAYNLPDGRYTLKIRANNNFGWDECPVKALRIEVRPPYYRSMLANFFYVLFILTLIFCGYRIMLRSFQRRKELLEKDIEHEKQEALCRSKIDFFTTISHELKTPLSLIVAPLKSISRENLSDTDSRHLDTALKNTGKMEKLISELVTFNKIESGQFPFYVQKGNPMLFVEQIGRGFTEMARSKDIKFTVDTEDNGETVWFSPSYAERIIDNLLSNAFKFTPSGGEVTLTASITTLPSDPKTPLLSIVVKDTGIGISQEEHQRIFTLYYQTRRGVNVDHGGWGIGLPLVKRMVDVHKGTVEVQSELGKGSRFSVLLNVSATAFPKECYTADDKLVVPVSDYHFTHPIIIGDEENADIIRGDAKEKPHTILLTEDDPGLLKFLSEFFEGKYKVFTARNGVEALQVVQDQMVEIVISDVMMPEMDGMELCRRIKGDMNTSHIPIILLTAKAEAPDVVAGYESGAEAYVSKPFDPQVLDLQVKNILASRQHLQTEILHSSEEEIPVSALGRLDKEFLQSLNELIEKNMSNADFSVNDVTESLNLSRTLLHRKMKTLVGVSISDYLRKRRLDHASELLRDGYNVQEVTAATGFSDPSYFTKLFKKEFGMTPKEYVKQ